MGTHLVTGATGGIGRATVRALAERGETVIATARSAQGLIRLRDEMRSLPVHVVQLDVTDGAAITSARAEALELTGGRGVDSVVHAAGIAELGPLMLVTPAALERHFETNAFGAMAVTRAFLPEMKSRRRGRIVHVGSVVDRLTLATHGAYGASAHALRAINDTLRQELAIFDIDVVLVEPGTVRTEFVRDAFAGLDAKRWSGSPWNPILDRLERLEPTLQRIGVEPDRVARTLIRAVTARRPQRRYVVANLSTGVQMTAARVLPTRAFDGLVRSTLGISPPRPAPVEDTVYRERPSALITGAAGGIGTQTALRLATSGYRVIATDVDEAGLERLAAQAEAESLRIDTLPLDVTDAASARAAVKRTDALTGGDGLDLLVNNAGYAELGPLDAVDTDAFRRQFRVNVYGLMNVTRAFVQGMFARRRGRIINVSSVAGLVAFPFMGVYHASKFAVEALSDALRQELGPFGIEVVVVQPSFIATGFAERARHTLDHIDPREWTPAFRQMDTIIGRMERVGGQPEEVAEAIHTAARSPEPRPRYQVPASAQVAARALPWVPAAVSDAVFSRMFSLPEVARSLPE